jgi:DNA-directed RNA polymerase subunit RPC12/RpoP
MGENVDWFPDGDPLPCPECKAAVPREAWEDTEVGCEDCGTHAAIRCPECGQTFEHVWGPQAFEGYNP